MNKVNSTQSRINQSIKNIKFILAPFEALMNGIVTNTIPWKICTGWSLIATLILFFKIDLFLISHTRFYFLYPYYPLFYKLYAFGFSSFAYWFWAWIQVKKNSDRLRLLTQAFKNASLESKMGRLPKLISDFSIDSMTRKMRLTNAGFPVTSFQSQSKFIESSLGVFIDEIKENRETRTVDFIYSHYPMAKEFLYSPKLTEKPFTFLIGQTRSNTVTASLTEIPHLLVAGQTGGGKSTFLRQLIIHLHLQKKQTSFLLIDLKGGLEFSMFDNRKKFIVVPHVLSAVLELQKINSLIDERMNFLKENDCKDIEMYFKKENKTKNAANLFRKVIVVDEAAEMFLAGHHAKSNEVQAARAILSRVARQGRALGIHLVVATQRPDSKSLDPQVKANLTGVICFQMMNDSSSIAVLGNGRATDLPKVAGRAIWKNGIEMLEVQTPFMSMDMAEALLGEIDNKSEQVVVPIMSKKNLILDNKIPDIKIFDNQNLDPSETE